MHCHILPGVDDGAGDWGEALAMARIAQAEGIETVIATPHQLGAYAKLDGLTIRNRTSHLQQFLHRRNVALRVLPGAEIRVEPDMIERIRSGEILTLADRGRYVLLEMPHEICLPLEGLLAELRRAGLSGVLAHPERNLGILAQPRLGELLAASGCYLQVTAASILGEFGAQVEAAAWRLIRRGVVHFIAGDAHNSTSRRPLLRRACRRLAEVVGQDAALTLCCRNPAALVDGGRINSIGEHLSQKKFARWFGRRKAS